MPSKAQRVVVKARLRPGAGWGKAERLLKHPQFCRVQNRGRRIGGKFMLMIFAPSSILHARFGITVSKRVGNAVVRNRVKRWLRELSRRHKNTLMRIDVVWIARASAKETNFAEFEADFLALLARYQRNHA